MIFVLKAGIPNAQVCFGGLREAKNVSRTIDLTSKELPISKKIVAPKVKVANDILTTSRFAKTEKSRFNQICLATRHILDFVPTFCLIV